MSDCSPAWKCHSLWSTITGYEQNASLFAIEHHQHLASQPLRSHPEPSILKIDATTLLTIHLHLTILPSEGGETAATASFHASIN